MGRKEKHNRKEGANMVAVMHILCPVSCNTLPLPADSVPSDVLPSLPTTYCRTLFSVTLYSPAARILPPYSALCAHEALDLEPAYPYNY